MNKRSGFTLVEVLIVLIIIGILATLAMPQISGMIERARTAEARNTLGAIRTALMAINLETGNFPGTSDGTAAVNVALGNTIEPNSTLFNYGFVTANGALGAIDRVTLTAERNFYNYNGVSPSAHACLSVVVWSDGAVSDMQVRYTAAAAAVPAQGAVCNVTVRALIPDGSFTFPAGHN